MAKNRVSFPIGNSSVIAVRLRALDGDLTNLNPNLCVGDVFIAEVSGGSGIAIFIAGVTAPDTTEQNLLNIPSAGIPSGDYEVMTASTKSGTLWNWDEQSEVSNITIVNQDLKKIFAQYLKTAKICNALDKEDSGYVLDARQGKVLKHEIDSHNHDFVYSKISDIVNNLTSSNTDKPLSAVQGKTLQDNKSDKLHNHDSVYSKISDIMNNLNCTDTDKPLSAAQGKVLKDTLDSITQNISGWIVGAESQERDQYIDIYMYLMHNNTLCYEAGGYYILEFFYKNDAGFPSGMTPRSDWNTEEIEGAGYPVQIISSSQSLVSIPKPDVDSGYYTSGEVGKATLVYHLKYKNALYETDFGQNELRASFSAPYGIPQIIEGLNSNTTFASIVAAKAATSATLVEAVRQAIDNV